MGSLVRVEVQLHLPGESGLESRHATMAAAEVSKAQLQVSEVNVVCYEFYVELFSTVG